MASRSDRPTSPSTATGARRSCCAFRRRSGARRATSRPTSRASSRRTPRRTSTRVEVAGSRLRQPLPRAHVAARRAARGRGRRATRYGHGDALAGRRINLEFVSANPTGPLHAGGGRWVAVGDAIANLLAAQGADGAPRVLPERRRQPARHLRRVAVSRATAARRRPRTATRASTSSRWPTAMRAELGDDGHRGAGARVGLPRTSSRSLQDDLGRIGVHFDTWFSERTLHERGDVERGARRPRRPGRRRSSTTAPTWLRADRLRRPARPRAREVRRHHHLSLQRPRVPPRQVRPRAGSTSSTSGAPTTTGR